MKLGLGTVQFGLPYGITNTEGQVSQQEAARILSFAKQSGITVLDTAAAYGNSEKVLGSLLSGHDQEQPFRIISKTIPLRCTSIGDAELTRVQGGLTASLTDLCVDKVSGVLVHHADDILVAGGERIYDLLQRWKSDGKTEKVGVSVYTSKQVETVLERYQIDLIQIPFNVLDQRLLENGLIAELKRRGVEIHARSVFLQGMLLIGLDQIPPMLERLRPVLERFDLLAKNAGMSRLEAALNFIQTSNFIDYAIVGALSVLQLQPVYEALRRLNACANLTAIDYATLKVSDERLINPALWA